MVLVTYVTITCIIPAASWHPKMQFIICAIVVYRNVWVSAFDLRHLKRHFRGQTRRIALSTRAAFTLMNTAGVEFSTCWI
jgi:hypothetical protein